MLPVRLFIFTMSIVFRPGVAFVLGSFRRTPPSIIKSGMVSFDTTSFTTRTSNEENDDLVLDPLVVCGPSGVGKVSAQVCTLPRPPRMRLSHTSHYLLL